MMMAGGSQYDGASSGRAGNGDGPGGGDGGGGRSLAGKCPWWASAWAYILIVAASAVIPLTFQAGRKWHSPIFEPPGYLNRDASEWLEIAGESRFLHTAAPMRLARPLYPAGAWILKHKFFPEKRSLHLYRALNVFWFLLALWGLRRWTLHWTPDPRAPLAAALVFAFSPFTQIYLSQPAPEMLGAAASVWVPLLAAWAAGWRAGFPRPPAGRKIPGALIRWAAAGALSAILMLGKEVYAWYFALFLIAAWRRAWKPMAAFAAAAVAVHLIYILCVVVWIGRAYQPYGANQQGFITWIFTDLLRRPLAEQAHWAWRLPMRIGLRTLQSVWFWPGVAAIIGMFSLIYRPKWYEVLAVTAAFLALFTATNIVTPRICFLMFPIFLPAAGAGVVRIADYLRVSAGARAVEIWILAIAAAFAFAAIADPYRMFYFG